MLYWYSSLINFLISFKIIQCLPFTAHVAHIVIVQLHNVIRTFTSHFITDILSQPFNLIGCGCGRAIYYSDFPNPGEHVCLFVSVSEGVQCFVLGDMPWNDPVVMYI